MITHLNCFKTEKEFEDSFYDKAYIFLNDDMVNVISPKAGVVTNIHYSKGYDNLPEDLCGIDIVGFEQIGWSKYDIINIIDTSSDLSGVPAIPQSDKNLVPMNMKKTGNVDKYCPYFDTSKVTSMNSMFYTPYPNYSTIVGIPKFDTGKVTNMQNMFMNCKYLQYIPELDTSNVTTMVNMFKSCTSLQTIPRLDTSKVTSTYQFLYNCPNVTNLGGFKGLKCNIELQYCPKLTHDSIIRVFLNAADDVSSGTNMWLGVENMAKINEQEKKIITDKGWTLLK